jgi:hypothetical protein
MARLILPTVSESDELFTNGFVIVQERRSVNPRRAIVGKSQQRRDKAQQRAATPMRQQSSLVWSGAGTGASDGASTGASTNGTKRKSRQSSSRKTKTTATDIQNLTILTKNHVIETTKHAKCVSDRIPRPPIRSLPSLYFS